MISGSGELAVPTHGITQAVLEWCYETDQPAHGWAERGQVGVAFRRSPTGLDAFGRPGAYFVHALVWRRGTMPASLLGDLWTAKIWRTKPEDPPPARLPPIRSTKELLLADPPTIDRSHVAAALSGHLAAAAEGRRSLLILPKHQAFLTAAAIAEALPQQFGLPAFSTYEADSHRQLYDIVAGSAQVPTFEVIGPNATGDRLWRAAADLLLDAEGGDDSLAAIIATLAAGKSSLRAFLVALRRWIAIDRAAPGISPRDLPALAEAAANPQLLERLLDRSRAGDVARAIVEGLGSAAILAASERIGRRQDVTGALETELVQRPTRDAVAALTALRREPGVDVATLALGVADAWERAGRVPEVEGSDGIALLHLLMAAGSSSLTDALIQSPAIARRVVSENALPADWRGVAAATQPDALPPEALALRLVKSHRFAEGYGRVADETAYGALRTALTSVDSRRAFEALQAVERHLPDGIRSEMAFSVITRLNARERLVELLSYAPPAAVANEKWSEAILDALVDLVLSGQIDRVPPPHIVARRLSSGSRRVGQWTDLLAALGAGSWDFARQASPVAQLAAAFDDRRDRDAALYVVAHVLVNGLAHAPREYVSAARTVLSVSREAPQRFTVRLAAVAQLPGPGDPRQKAYATMHWVDSSLRAGEINSADARQPPISELYRGLRQIDIALLADRCREARGAARKWWKVNLRALSQLYDERGRL